MIKFLGCDYTAKLTLEVEMKVTAHDEEKAGDEALDITEDERCTK